MNAEVSASQSQAAKAGALVARAGSIEKVMYASIGRAIARKPLIPQGAKGFYYHAPTLTILLIFIVLSTAEIFIIDMIVHRWIWVRIPMLIIGIWGVVWMLGLLSAHFMRPHTVGPEGIRVRDGMDLDLAISWRDIDSVAVEKRVYEPKTPKLIEDEHGRTFVKQSANETNIVITLEGPTTFALPGIQPKGGEQTVNTICFWVDEPKALLGEVRKHIGG